MNLNIVIPEDKITVDFIKETLMMLIDVKDKNGIQFVYGKCKRKSPLQKFVESLKEFIEKQTKYDEYNVIFDGRNSFLKTDHDTTFMHMKEYHMRNGQLTLIPFLDKLESNIGCKYESVTADTGYKSGKNYTYLEANNQKAYIKPQVYEKSKTSKFKKNIIKRENIIYNNEDDSYICAADRKLSALKEISNSMYQMNL